MRDISPEKIRARPEQAVALCRQMAGFVALHAGEYASRPNTPKMIAMYGDDQELPLLNKPWANSSFLTIPGDLVRELAPRAARRLQLGSALVLNRRNTFEHYYIRPSYNSVIPDDPYDLPRKALVPVGQYESVTCYMEQAWPDGREVEVRLNLSLDNTARSPATRDADSLSPLLTSEVPDAPLAAECRDLSQVISKLSGLWPEQIMRYMQASAEFDAAGLGL